MTTITIRDHDGADVIMDAELDGTAYSFKTVPKGGPTRVYQEVTRPANTTPYTAGDCIADNAASATTQYITAGRLAGLGGKITKAKLMTDLTTWTDDVFVVLYDDEPASWTADHAAFPGMVYSEKAGIIGGIDFDTMAADVTGGCAQQTVVTDLNFSCATSSQKIYFQMFTDGTPTPASGQKFTLVLHIDQN